MSAQAARVGGRPERARPLARRAIAAVPALGAALVVLVFYLVEAALQKTPWVFTDELEWTQISRAIAASGHAARRGQPVFFKSFYAYLIAPAWWIHSTADAYAAIKDLDTVVMLLAAVPVYLLARIVCPRPAAIAVAALAIAIPGMTYATALVPESLAYTWFCLAAWLAVRALAAPSLRRAAPAVLVAALGPLIEKEFVVLPVSFVLAAAVLWLVSSGRGLPLRHKLARTLAAAAGLALFGYLFNLLVVERVQQWSIASYVDDHTLTAGALAFGSLAIGLGMLPLIGGIASLALPERRDPAYRAFAAYLGASIVALGVYTALKVTHLGAATTLIEERNLFFLSPLLLCGTALALGARRLDWRLVALATAAALALVWSAHFEQVGADSFEAPGLSMLVLVNREFIFFVSDCRTMLAVAAAVSVALLALRRRRRIPELALVLLAAWLLTGEVYATITNEQAANADAAALPAPRGWLDAATHGQPVAFLGQGSIDTRVLWLTEFWNRSLDRVGSLTGNAPGPGPAIAPGLNSSTGGLDSYTGDPYTLAGPGVTLDAHRVARRVLDGETYTLYRTVGGWRLLKAEEGVDSDGWQPGYAYYTYFDPGGPGTLTIDLSRTAYNGPGPPAQVTVTVGLRWSPSAIAISDVVARLHARVPNGKEVPLSLPVERTPLIVKVFVSYATLIAQPGRLLGVQAAIFFSRGRHAPGGARATRRRPAAPLSSRR